MAANGGNGVIQLRYTDTNNNITLIDGLSGIGTIGYLPKNINFGYDFENMLDGIVGYAYPLPVFANQNGITAKLEVLEGSEYVDITDQLANGFTPTKAGQYKIAYKANNLYYKTS